MYITSISLSYVFLGLSLISLLFFIYFKTILLKSSQNNNLSKKIIGTMKDPETWKSKNNQMAYVSLLWTVLSMTIFIFLKFFYGSKLLSIIYLFVYIALIVVTIFMVILQKNVVK
ncbi:hypothetical protein ACFIJ5_05930 [Haloimpatiens sp. FM7330]|uniref:hypothetical protein n=1 Tax=Haloimpatiens sp. FM7330 TaxID=3298610 RepID=UPI003645CBF7